MKKTILSLLSVIMIAALLLTACGPRETTPTEAPTQAPTTEPAPPSNDTTWDAIQEAGVIVVGTSADYPPFEFINEANDFDGFDIALIREIGNRLGLRVEIRDMAFDGLIAALRAGQINAIIAAMSATPERAQQVDFTINYFVGTDAILVAEGSGLSFEDALEIASYRVGVQTGTIHEQWVEENLIDAGLLTSANFTRYERAEQAILDLRNGRIDVVAMDFFAAKAYLEQGGIVLALEQNLAGENMAIALPKGASVFLAEMNAVIQELQAEGFVDQLAEQYLAGEAVEEEPILSDPTWDAIQEAGVIVVGTSADYPPFEFINEANDFDGFDIALIREIGNRLGLRVEIRDMAFDGLIAALRAGQINAIIAAMSATPERAQQVDFTINYFVGTDAILVAEGSGLAFEDALEIAGYRVGVQTGTIHEQWVEENLIDAGLMSPANFTRYERAEQAILDLRNGRIDVVAMDFFAANAYLEQGGIVLALEQNLAGENMAIAIPKGAEAFLAQLNAVIQELQDEGFVDQLAEQYLAEE